MSAALYYRLYCFDGVGKVWAAEWIHAGSDEEAIHAAHRMDIGIKCELWEGKRLVATIQSPSRAPRVRDGAGWSDLAV
jgi:hypothetical protein